MDSLISREQAIEALRVTPLYIAGIRTGKTIFAQYTERCRNSFVATIEDLPVVKDVEYVRHGHWISHGKTEAGAQILECSYCHKIRSGGGRSNYCRDCGAKMDKEE